MYVITEVRPYGYGRPKIRYSREAWMRVKDPLPMRKGREAQGYSQRDLAALCRCSQEAISALERGSMRSCSDDLARTICRWIKRDVEEVFVAPESIHVPAVTSAVDSTPRRGSARRSPSRSTTRTTKTAA